MHHNYQLVTFGEHICLLIKYLFIVCYSTILFSYGIIHVKRLVRDRKFLYDYIYKYVLELY